MEHTYWLVRVSVFAGTEPRQNGRNRNNCKEQIDQASNEDDVEDLVDYAKTAQRIGIVEKIENSIHEDSIDALSHNHLYS